MFISSYYMIYGKADGMRRYLPVGRDSLVIRKIHALMFWDLSTATIAFEDMKSQNPDITFQLREIRK